MSALVAYVDGGSHGNPGPSGIGVVLEDSSGGKTRIARTGRPLIRAILNQMALPLVKRDRLYGPYYHHKTGVQKMPGKKARPL